MSAHNPTPRTRGGLTILEIIVLLVVLVILAAVLFPIFARTRGHARTDDCQNNLKECAMALLTYANDYNDHLPSSILVRGSKTWNQRDFVAFTSKPAAIPPNTQGRPRSWAQALYNHMINRGIVFCPSDPTDQQSPDAQVSYHWKAAADKAWFGVGCKQPYRRMNDFGYCADQVILYERAGYHHRCPQGLRNSVRINVAYLDTHVKSIALTNSLPADGRKWVTSPTAPGEPAYYNFDNSKPKKDSANPPSPEVRPIHTDPSRYSDMLP